jgi:hypothetical protein
LSFPYFVAVTTQVVCFEVPSATNVNLMKSPDAIVVVPLCVPAAKLLEHVTAPVSKAVAAPLVAANVLEPELSVKHLIPVIVTVTPESL